MGLLDPATSDGRVIFFLPWQGSTIAGTTDSPSAVTRDPVAKEEEIAWILDEVRHYLSPDIKVRRGDVLSAWTGLRPLVRDPNATGDSKYRTSEVLLLFSLLVCRHPGHRSQPYDLRFGIWLAHYCWRKVDNLSRDGKGDC